MKPENPARSIALLAVLVVVVGGGIVYWQYAVHGDAEARLSKLRAETPDETKLQQQLKDAQADLYKETTDLVHLEKGVPTLAYVPTLLQELEEVGKSHDMQVTVFKQALQTSAQSASSGDAKSLKSKPYEEVEFDVSGRGSYQSIGDMLTALQSFPKIVSVESVGVLPKHDPTGKSPDSVEATMRLKAYMFKSADDSADKGNLVANNAPGGGQ